MNAHTTEERNPGERQLTVRVLAMPADTNPTGDIFGGWLMSQVDIAGAILAVQVARGRVATVAVHEFQFIKPVLVGDLVSCYSELEHVGNTSIRVKVDVYAEREIDPRTLDQVARASITYVSVDENARPRPLPPRP
ncbi:MAG: acyl-CoA thioesterase [Gammaproteobacteria bacterium]|nr:acyl-CoA thioesterase [Gammaproteobacteria bacterium]